MEYLYNIKNDKKQLITLKQFEFILMGRKCKKSVYYDSIYGLMKGTNKNYVKSILKNLVFKGYLKEIFKSFYGFVNSYLFIQKNKANVLLKDKEKFIIKIFQDKSNLIEKNNNKIDKNDKKKTKKVKNNKLNKIQEQNLKVQTLENFFYKSNKENIKKSETLW